MRKPAYVKENQKKYRRRETAAKKALLEAQTFHNWQFSIISAAQKSYDIFKSGDWVNLRFLSIDNNREWNLVCERAQIS